MPRCRHAFRFACESRGTSGARHQYRGNALREIGPRRSDRGIIVYVAAGWCMRRWAAGMPLMSLIHPPRLSVRVLLALCLLLSLGCVFKVRNYDIPRRIPFGWIVVDSNRAGCPPLGGGAAQTIAIPVSGYVCTSSPPYSGLAWHRFYLVDENGGRHKLDTEHWIHREISLHGRRSAYGPCNYDADAFYYGPSGTVGGSPEAVLIAHRSDCRPTGGASAR